MRNQSDLLQTAVKNALNVSFPSMLRSRSWYGFEFLHQWASYEQWYNGELVMHLGHELQWAYFDTGQVRVRGEAPIGEKRGLDWAIVDAKVKDEGPFKPSEVLVAGETKIIGLGAAGQGPNAESGTLRELARQLNAAPLCESIRIAFLVLPCCPRKRNQECIDDTVRDAVNGFLSETIREAFGVDLKMNDLQVITGLFQICPPECVWKFALLQCVVMSAPGTEVWEVVAPPCQHQLEVADEKQSNRKRETASGRNEGQSRMALPCGEGRLGA